jgi:hypothetical protein
MQLTLLVTGKTQLFVFCRFSKGEKWYDKLLNVKYLPLFHHFKAIYKFPKHIIYFVKCVANSSLRDFTLHTSLSPYATDLTSDR